MTKVKTHKSIRKGDKVIAIAGNYKGQSGEVLRRIGEKSWFKDLMYVKTR